MSHVVQAKQKQEKVARRREKVQRIVQACPEVAAASQLQHLCTAVQAHVPDVEQSCIMVQWMMQEVADLGISGITWNPAKVTTPPPSSMPNCLSASVDFVPYMALAPTGACKLALASWPQQCD